jgi:hypothetical protein
VGFRDIQEPQRQKKGDLTLPDVEKFDAFNEIKVDDTGRRLNLSFDMGTITKFTSGSGTWGSSWNTGTTRLVFLSKTEQYILFPHRNVCSPRPYVSREQRCLCSALLKPGSPLAPKNQVPPLFSKTPEERRDGGR